MGVEHTLELNIWSCLLLWWSWFEAVRYKVCPNLVQSVNLLVIFRLPNRRKTFVMMNYIAHKGVRNQKFKSGPNEYIVPDFNQCIRKIHFTAFENSSHRNCGYQHFDVIHRVHSSWVRNFQNKGIPVLSKYITFYVNPSHLMDDTLPENHDSPPTGIIKWNVVMNHLQACKPLKFYRWHGTQLAQRSLRSLLDLTFHLHVFI